MLRVRCGRYAGNILDFISIVCEGTFSRVRIDVIFSIKIYEVGANVAIIVTRLSVEVWLRQAHYYRELIFFLV